MPGRSTPGKKPDPNYDLYRQYGGKAKYEAALKERNDAKAKAKNAAGNTADYYYKANEALTEQLRNPVNGLYEQRRVAVLQGDNVLRTFLDGQITKIKAKMRDNGNKAELYISKVKEAQEKFTKKKVVPAKDNKGTGDSDQKAPTQFAGKWKFNAPMVNKLSALDKNELPKMISSGSEIEGDAKLFWTNNENGGGKGTIQMDRQTNTLEILAQAQKASKTPKQFDPNFYGFKFHYNPTTVNMTWAGMAGSNPVFQAAGLDPAVPFSQNLFTGMINFVVVLNRIQDLALLNKDGTYKNGVNPYSPVEVRPEDLKEIANKGTMHDVEYLFHAMHGFMTSTNYKSTLMGRTNDPGWLPVRPVELHLGNKLRYRVRVASLEVNHKIFNQQMVPIFSEVSISCMRYWDGPSAGDPKKDTSGGGGGGGGGRTGAQVR
jgi:hypothetical protein